MVRIPVQTASKTELQAKSYSRFREEKKSAQKSVDGLECFQSTDYKCRSKLSNQSMDSKPSSRLISNVKASYKISRQIIGISVNRFIRTLQSFNCTSKLGSEAEDADLVQLERYYTAYMYMF